MNRRQFLISAATLAGATTLPRTASLTDLSAKDSESPRLLWSDEFDSLDLASPANPGGAWRPNDIWQDLEQGYQDFGAGGSTWNINPNQPLAGSYRSNFGVQDSVLTLSAIPTPLQWASDIAASNNGSTPPKCGCILITNTNVRSFGYGYFEFRMSLPNPGQGMFPALWLYAAKGHNTAADKGGAEIDVVEVFGHRSGQPWNTTLHSAGNNNVSQIGDDDVATTTVDTTGWHIYGVDWTADHLHFYRDGSRVGAGSSQFVSWLAGTQMDIRMNYAMDATWFGPSQRSTASTPDRLDMMIDYVRVYAAMPGDPPPPPDKSFLQTLWDFVQRSG